MNSNILCRRLLILIAGITMSFGAMGSSVVFAQARRQPPASDQKKNKRPPEGQQTEEQKPEPVPKDITGKPQTPEKPPVPTNLANLDPVLSNKTTGHPTFNLK